MKVFISWSKPTSYQLALALRSWLPEVIQQVDPWMSSEDISKGQRWGAEIGAKLEGTSQGLICVTPDNVGERWLNFEAGALAKSLVDASVRPVLLGIRPSGVTGPLAQFQATTITDRQDAYKLVKSLNEFCETPLEEDRLDRAFTRTWDDLLAALKKIKTEPTTGKEAAPRPLDDMISENAASNAGHATSAHRRLVVERGGSSSDWRR